MMPTCTLLHMQPRDIVLRGTAISCMHVLLSSPDAQPHCKCCHATPLYTPIKLFIYALVVVTMWVTAAAAGVCNLQQQHLTSYLPAGLVVDACNSFKWPEDAESTVKLLSTMLADTANVQIVVMLPGACLMSRSQWVVDTPPHMSRYPTPDPYMLEVFKLW